MNEILSQIDEKIKEYDPNRFTRLNDEWRRLVGYQNYYRWLWAAVGVLQPHYVVEIGRERGVSTLIMLDALPKDSTLFSVDIVEESIFLDDLQDERLFKITMNSLIFADMLLDGIDFLFIDGDHTGTHVAKEWDLYSPKLRDNAVVVFDDIHFNQGMTDFWNSLPGEKYDISQWHEMGFGVLFYRRN